MRFVDDRRPQCAGSAEQRRGNAQIACQHDVYASGSHRAAEREGEVSHSPGDSGSDHWRPFDRQPIDSWKAVEHVRVARRLRRVRPDDHVDLVPTSRQRMAGLHRLDSVCALERKPDVSEIQDAHGTHGTRAAGWAR